MDPNNTDAALTSAPKSDRQHFQAVAYYIGERIDVRNVTFGTRLGSRPLTLALENSAIAVVFRWGAVVFIDADQRQIERLLTKFACLVEQPYDIPETETVTVRIDALDQEGLDGDLVKLQDRSLERLQILANILGKTVALAQYESDVAANFDRIEPFARDLEQGRHRGRSLRELLRHIGRALLNENKLLGRVEVAEKPELLWEHPQLESLYARLETEYELGERAAMLDRKLELSARTVRTVADLVQQRRTLRVEWYIVILIIVEIFLLVYDMLLRN